MARPNCSLALALLLVACGSDPPPRDAGPDDAGAVDAGLEDAGPVDAGPPALPSDVFALDGIGEEGTAESYAAIDRVVGAARYVGIGESIHTSGGFHEANHALARHLVEALGFRAFAIELPWDGADEVARWVETCPDADPRPAMVAGHFGVWSSEEVAALLTYLCEWNGAHPDDPVVAFGFDIQQPWDDGPAIREFLRLAASAEADAFVADLDGCHGVNSVDRPDFHANPPPQTVETHARCLAGLDAVEAWLDENEADAIAATSEDGVWTVRLRLRGLRAWEHETYHSPDHPEPDPRLMYEARDRAMADTLRALHDRRAPEARTIVWAHNSHLSMAYDRIEDSAYPGARSMGTVLAAEEGDGYVAIGLLAYVTRHWRFWDPAGGTEMLLQPVPGSAEERLHVLGRPYLFVDLGPATGERVFAPDAPIQINFTPQVPAEQFGGLLFLDRSDEMTWLPPESSP